MFILKLFWRILHFGTTIFDCANFFVPFWKTSDKVTMKSRFVRQIFNTKINYLSNSAETTQLYIKINHGWLTLILIAENDRLETTLLFCFEYTGNTLISRYIVLPFLPIIFSTDLTHVRKYLRTKELLKVVFICGLSKSMRHFSKYYKYTMNHTGVEKKGIHQLRSIFLMMYYHILRGNI